MVEILEIERSTELVEPAVRQSAFRTLEGGGVVFLPRRSFAVTSRERAFFDPAIVNQPRHHTGRARIIFEPTLNKSRKAALQDEAKREMEAMVVRFTAWARQLVRDLLPRYEVAAALGPATFRPCPRTAPQGLHVDSFFFLPTQGRRVLRVFTNVNPDGRPRVWQIGEPFDSFAEHFLPRVWRLVPGSGWFLERAGITQGRRTPYDHTMRQLRNLAKRDPDYQRKAPRSIVEFPSGSTWVVFTDAVLHGAIAGQFAFEQTLLMPIAAMQEPGYSPLRVLERRLGRMLAKA